MNRRQFLGGLLLTPLAVGVLGACSGEDQDEGDGGKVLGSADAPVTEAVIVSPAMLFDVRTIYVPVGQPVTFTYRNEHEGVPHNFHVSGDGVDAKTELRPGPDVQDVTATFPGAGEFGYVCDVHPSMTGVVRAV